MALTFGFCAYCPEEDVGKDSSNKPKERACGADCQRYKFLPRIRFRGKAEREIWTHRLIHS